MAGKVLTYSPSDVTLSVCGYKLGGLLNIGLSLNTQQMQIRRGIRGQSTRVRNTDLSARLVIDVMQTSVTNEVLFEIWRLDRQKQTARLDLALVDGSGRTQLQTAEAYISTLPDVTFTSGFSARQWTFEILSVTDGLLTGASDQGIDFLSGLPGAEILNNIAGIADRARSAVNTVTSFL